MRRFTVDCRSVRSISDFVDAVNLGLIQRVGGKWNGNLDAFRDHLSWPEDCEYELELLGAENCPGHLGHAAQVEWLRSCLENAHPSNLTDLNRRIARAEAGEGETFFDVIEKIILETPRVRLLLR